MTTPTPSQTLAWMPFYVGDYIARTRHLTLQQRGALMDLIALSWTTGPLPGDQSRMAAMIGVSIGEFRKLWPAISSWWSEDNEGRLFNAELEQRRTEALRVYNARAQAGRDSAQKRTRSKADPKPNGHDHEVSQS
jgi:uncharacterized protein YdaU (DUF1376 family)